MPVVCGNADVKTRWWAMRDAVQQLQGGAIGLALQAATFFPEEVHLRVRKKLVQYAVCIHEVRVCDATSNISYQTSPHALSNV